MARQTPFCRPVVIIFGLLLSGTLVCSGMARPLTAAATRLPKVVVIDPGHGGLETGAIGPGGTTEKGLTLLLAQQIREELADHYRTVLTRSDDYRMGIADRTAMANNQNADLFISLHAGGAYDSHLDGISVVIFGGLTGTADGVDVSGQMPTGFTPWSLGYLPHISESRRLAKILVSTLSAQYPSRPVPVVEAPLAVLAGADMPAALIEIGYLTHPATELRLKEPERVADLARAIAAGIDDFFLK